MFPGDTEAVDPRTTLQLARKEYSKKKRKDTCQSAQTFKECLAEQGIEK